MIPEAKGLIYSYRDFSVRDLALSPDDIDYDIGEILSSDTLNFEDLNSEELSKFILKNHAQYRHDMNADQLFRNKYFFKEFCTRFYSADDDDSDVSLINHYVLSDWNPSSKRNGIDDRNLTVKMLSKRPDDADYHQDLRFIVKSEHVYQLIKDVAPLIRRGSSILNDESMERHIVTDNEINLYMLPIYILRIGSGKYYRISDYSYHEITYPRLRQILVYIYGALKMFVATNFYMLKIYNSDQKVEVYNTRTKRFSTKTFKSYSANATSDKIVYSYVDDIVSHAYSPSVRIDINADRENVMAGTDIPRKLCDYRYSVRGHWSHRWVGKKDERRLERIWIDPYEKNKDKPYKIIKEQKIKGEENNG